MGKPSKAISNEKKYLNVKKSYFTIFFSNLDLHFSRNGSQFTNCEAIFRPLRRQGMGWRVCSKGRSPTVTWSNINKLVDMMCGNLYRLQRGIQNPVKHVRWSFLLNAVNYFRKKLRLRCLTGFWILLWVVWWSFGRTPIFCSSKLGPNPRRLIVTDHPWYGIEVSKCI